MNLEKILQNDKRIWDEEILDYPQLFELARTYDKDFQKQPLEEQKTLFKALLDNNQLYIPYKEQEDCKYNLSKEDQKLTNEFYG